MPQKHQDLRRSKRSETTLSPPPKLGGAKRSGRAEGGRAAYGDDGGESGDLEHGRSRQVADESGRSTRRISG